MNHSCNSIMLPCGEQSGCELRAFDQMFRRREVIPSETSSLTRVLDEVIELLAEFAYDESDLSAIGMALCEALTNAMVHGNCNDAQKSVLVSYVITDRKFWVRIQDEADGFMPATLHDPTTEEHLELPHGRGLYMMRHLITRLRFIPPGNCVVMVFERCDVLDPPVQQADLSKAVAT